MAATDREVPALAGMGTERIYPQRDSVRSVFAGESVRGQNEGTNAGLVVHRTAINAASRQTKGTK